MGVWPLLQQPRPPKGLSETKQFARVFWDLVKAKPDRDLTPPCRQQIFKGDAVNLDNIPLIRPWPGDAGGVITLELVITKDPETGVPNVGVYRLQKQSVNTMTVHWLSVQGGARHLRKAAAMEQKAGGGGGHRRAPAAGDGRRPPIPVQLSEWLFAGIYAEKGCVWPPAKPSTCRCPATAKWCWKERSRRVRCCRMVPSAITWASTAVWRTHRWCASTA